MGARACGLQPGGPLAALRARAWRLTTLASRPGAACPRPGRRGLARCLRRLPSCSPRLPQPPAGSGDALGRPAPGVSREQSAPGAAAWGPARGATWWGRAARSSRSRAVVPEGSSPSPRRVRGFASLRRLKPAEGAASCPWRAGGCLTGRGDRHTCGRLGMAPAPRLLKSPPPSPGTRPSGSPAPAPCGPAALPSVLPRAAVTRPLAPGRAAAPHGAAGPAVLPDWGLSIPELGTPTGPSQAGPWGAGGQAEGLRPSSRTRSHWALWGPLSGAGGLSVARAGRPGALGGQEGRARALRSAWGPGSLPLPALAVWPRNPNRRVQRRSNLSGFAQTAFGPRVQPRAGPPGSSSPWTARAAGGDPSGSRVSAGTFALMIVQLRDVVQDGSV